MIKEILFVLGFLLSEAIHNSRKRVCDYVALHDVDLIPLNEKVFFQYHSTKVINNTKMTFLKLWLLQVLSLQTLFFSCKDETLKLYFVFKP